MGEPNFALDRNDGRWSKSLGEGIMIPLDDQFSDTPDGYLNASIMPEEAERQHGPLEWYVRPDDVQPEDFQP